MVKHRSDFETLLYPQLCGQAFDVDNSGAKKEGCEQPIHIPQRRNLSALENTYNFVHMWTASGGSKDGVFLKQKVAGR